MAENHELERAIAVASKSEPKPLRKNPFTTYRDPETGRWIVVKPALVQPA